MTASYREFCAHYSLDPRSDKAQREYGLYIENLAAMNKAAAQAERDKAQDKGK